MLAKRHKKKYRHNFFRRHVVHSNQDAFGKMSPPLLVEHLSLKTRNKLAYAFRRGGARRWLVVPSIRFRSFSLARPHLGVEASRAGTENIVQPYLGRATAHSKRLKIEAFVASIMAWALLGRGCAFPSPVPREARSCRKYDALISAYQSSEST